VKGDVTLRRTGKVIERKLDKRKYEEFTSNTVESLKIILKLSGRSPERKKEL